MTPFEPGFADQHGPGRAAGEPRAASRAYVSAKVTAVRQAIGELREAVLMATPGVLGMPATGLDGDTDENLAEMITAYVEFDAVITLAGTRAADESESWRGFAALLREHGKLSEAEIRATRRTGQIITEYPQLAQLWAGGEISDAQIRHIGQLASKLPVDLRSEAVQALADHAPNLTHDELTKAGRVLLNAVQPGWDERLAEREEKQSYFSVFREGDGYGVSGRLTVEQGGWLRTVLDALTGVQASDDMRSKSERQAEALTTIMRQYATSDVIPNLAMAKPQFLVMIDVRDALAIVNDAAPGDLPTTAWGDRLDAVTTRRMLSDCDLTPVLVKSYDTKNGENDPGATRTFVDAAFDEATAHRLNSALRILTRRKKSKEFAKRFAPPIFLRLLTTPIEPVAVGRTTRTINRHLRAACTIRDLHCVVPGCDMPAHRCEIHHVVPWALGGPTDIDNLATLCVRHHRTVENGKWRLRPRTQADGPGRYWIAEAGV